MKAFRWPPERHSPDTVAKVAEMYARGLTRGQIALKLGKGVSQISHILHHYGMARGEADAERCAKITRALTHERLAWAYGEARAARIMAGQDFATNQDIARWRSLGEREAA